MPSMISAIAELRDWKLVEETASVTLSPPCSESVSGKVFVSDVPLASASILCVLAAGNNT